MFTKVLIANRGEIAVRILRACRDLGLESLALYEPEDRQSLHVRLADQCLPVHSEAGYLDGEVVVEAALSAGAQAVHPGDSYLAERADFARLCEQRGLKFIGPPAKALAEIQAMQEAGELAALEPPSAEERLIQVQILADAHGNLIHLGERCVSLAYDGYPLIEEAPAPGLSKESRSALWEQALDLARRYTLEGAGAIEFRVGPEGKRRFTGIKTALQGGHPLNELVSGVDLAAWGIRIAAGERLTLSQEQVRLEGWAVQCRIQAVDPWNDFLPSPGRIQNTRFPGGPGIRVDTHIFSGYGLPLHYSPLLAKLSVHAGDREACLRRMRRALKEFSLSGITTNLPLLQLACDDPQFLAGQSLDGRLLSRIREAAPGSAPPQEEMVESEEELRDLAAAAAVLYLRRKERSRPELPERLLTGWHHSARRLDR